MRDAISYMLVILTALALAAVSVRPRPPIPHDIRVPAPAADTVRDTVWWAYTPRWRKP